MTPAAAANLQDAMAHNARQDTQSFRAVIRFAFRNHHLCTAVRIEQPAVVWYKLIFGRISRYVPLFALRDPIFLVR